MNIRYIKGIGPRKEKLFNKLGIYTVRDILYYFPLRYEDRRNIKRIKDLKGNDAVLVRAQVMAKNLRPIKSKPFWGPKSKYSIFEVMISDDTGIASCVWFNQGYLSDYIKTGQKIFVYGKIRIYKGRPQFSSPEFEILNASGEDRLNVGRIVGFYHLTEGITQKVLRKTVNICLSNFIKDIDDPLPYYIRKEQNYPNIAYSLKNVHFPESVKVAALCRQRFIFEELFLSQIRVYLRKAKHRFQKSIPFIPAAGYLQRLKNNLSFKLTASQESVIAEILSDLENSYPMRRLLQGDVGSGKTVVACFALAAAVLSKSQAAFMVPTETLVYQHAATMEEIFKGFNFRIKMLTSSISKQEKKKIYEGLKQGGIDIVIGTHALLEDPVHFRKLGLIVIDEQHKFGVAQRALLPKKGGKRVPHCLVMSATPIPRSLALSLYGDLDISLLKELPPGRKQPKTLCISEDKRRWMYNFLRQKIKEGRQAYIIYPIIEESQFWDLKSVEEMYELIKEEFHEFKTAVFHGRMPSDKKQKIIKEFRGNKINILVATTVIEVGINIENAVVMVVENPERFGLSQLHQLRGRIRRSTYEPHLILISNSNISDNASKRLEIISEVSDGFKIAEEDLKLRGPGDFFGTSQAGFPQLRIADPLKDIVLLSEARRAAYKVIKEDSGLEKSSHRCIREHLDLLAAEQETF